jgi:hypothetical protein
MAKISSLSLVRNPEIDASAPSIEMLRERVQSAVAEALCVVQTQATGPAVTYREVERAIREAVLGVGRALLVLFLGLREAHVMAEHHAKHQGRYQGLTRSFRVAPPIARSFTTWFGVVRYHRTYLRQCGHGERHGFHPLDVSLGLNQDRFSWNVLMVAARLATKMAFAEAKLTLGSFVPDAPSTEVIEKTVLGLGNHAADFVEQAPAPSDDGDVLVVLFDGKGAPTVTERELARRRKKHSKHGACSSRRHRGRQRRSRHPRQPRRNKGDKSKNAKMATMVVMYTLRRVGTRRLEGPINVRHYASFAPKRHAFEVARRLADKRGFRCDSGKLVQVLTDGDRDLAQLCVEFFPDAEHTVDFYHVLEYVHVAGECLLREGSQELAKWFDEQRQRLLDDQAEHVVHELRAQLAAISKTGPGNKGRRERLEKALLYIERRLPNIRYGALRRRDLEIGTGAVEGAVKRIIGRRCDHGGMRWIRERVEAVVQLRCIEINGQWDHFEAFVHERLHLHAVVLEEPQRLQTSHPAPLPEAA